MLPDGVSRDVQAMCKRLHCQPSFPFEKQSQELFSTSTIRAHKRPPVREYTQMS